MNKLSADEIIMQGHKRAYIQYGGPRPNNPVRFAGQDSQYMSITGVSAPELGGVDPVWVKDPANPRKYRLIARSFSPPDLASATITLYEKHGMIPRQLLRSCPGSIYEVSGSCTDLSDLYSGWSDYVLIYSNFQVTDKNLGDRVTHDSDDPITDELSITLADIYPAGALSFGDNAHTLIDKEVIDVVYGGVEACGDCGPENDGTRWIYAVTKSSGSGSPGLPAELIYSTDGGATWTEASINGIGVSEDPVAIEIVGRRLVIVSPTAGGASSGGIYWADIDPDTGVPGTWTKVITGFEFGHEPRAIYVLSPREVFLVGDGGYIYKTSDITAGVETINAGDATQQDLLRVDGLDEVIVAVGASGAVVASRNRGATWAAAADSPAVSDIQALEVVDRKYWWVGTAAGGLYYTLDGGKSWYESSFSGSGSGEIHDILFPTDECGFVLHSTVTPTARIFATIDGGRQWTNSAPRILNWPTFNDAKRLACPRASAGTAVNNVAVAGVDSNGDGVLLLGIAAKF